MQRLVQDAGEKCACGGTGRGGGAHLQSDIRLGAVSLVGLVW